MKLRTLVRGCLVGTALGLVVVGGASLHAWGRIGEGLRQLETTDALRQQLGRLSATVDYITLLRGDLTGFQSLAEESRALADKLEALDAPAASLGARHLGEMVVLSELGARQARQDTAGTDLATGLMDRPAALQMRIHMHEVSAVLERLTNRAQRQVFLDQQRITVLGLFGAIAFALLAFVGFLTIRQRVSKPVYQIQQGLRRVGEGDLQVAIPVLADDELGELARTFNEMVERRREQQKALMESEARLRQSQRLESVGQLTGGVAHDFNNLLTVVQGNAELLMENLAGDEEQRALAAMVLSAAERGAELTRALLAFARRLPLDPLPFDLNAQINSLQPLLRRTLGEDIEIHLRLTADLPRVLADPTQLESAVLNLCLNARDAMRAGGGQLTLETGLRQIDGSTLIGEVDLAPGDYVVLAVTDTGCGIPADQLPRVLEPFYTTKEVGAGTGLGLPMVYGFCKQSGGHLTLYSESGEGTTVRLYLPPATGVEEVPPASATIAAPIPGGGETILLVEDDALVRQFAASQLGELGYRVLAAESGQAALAWLDAHPDIDLLFTDIIMPGGMNGRQLADTVRQRCPDVAILFTTGYTENAVVHHGRLDAGVDLLSKPYRRAELAQRVREALDRRREPSPLS